MRTNDKIPLALSVIMFLLTADPFCPAATPDAPVAQVQALVTRYDANGNGKIDVEERKGFVRELARYRLEQAKRSAALRQSVRALPEPPVARRTLPESSPPPSTGAGE